MTKSVLIAMLLSLGQLPLFSLATVVRSDTVRVYVGTYTRGASEGIYMLELDLGTGVLLNKGLVAAAEQPSFVALSPDGRFLYAVNELVTMNGQETGGVSAYRIDPASGSLTFLNQQMSLGGAPCYLVVDQAGKHVLVANYAGGNVAVLPILESGELGIASAIVQHEGSGPNTDRQEGPHAHSINLDGDGRFAIAADLGLDKLLVYGFNSENGTLTPHEPPHAMVEGGAGPRHLAFTPDGRFAYVVNELSMTVSAFAYDGEKGTLTPVQTISTLPGPIESGYSTAEIQVHPSGKFLYASNRGHDTIAVFTVDPESGRLSTVEHASTLGRTPRNFRIDPTGRFLLVANQNSNTVVVFEIDSETGRLASTGHEASVPTPVCLRFAGRS